MIGLARPSKPRRLIKGATSTIRDASMVTVDELTALHGRIEAQVVTLRGKTALMEDGRDKLEAELFLLTLLNKQADVANQIDAMIGKKDVKAAKHREKFPLPGDEEKGKADETIEDFVLPF